MAFIPVINVAQVCIRGRYLGERVENTFYYHQNDTILQADLQALVDAISDVVVSDWLQWFPFGWSGQEVFARDLTSADGYQVTNTDILGVPGTFSANNAPGNVTLAFKRASAHAGRSARGRIFWQAFGKEAVTGNTIDAPTATAILEVIRNVDGAAAALDWVPVIVSLYENHLPRAAGVTYAILNWSWVDNAVDSMRRRLQGRGQ